MRLIWVQKFQKHDAFSMIDLPGDGWYELRQYVRDEITITIESRYWLILPHHPYLTSIDEMEIEINEMFFFFIFFIFIFHRARNQTQALSFIIKSCPSQIQKKRNGTIPVHYSESNEAIHH